MILKKRCSKCKEYKTFDKFYNNRSKKDGKHCQCKECMNVDLKAYKRKHPEQHCRYNNKWNHNNRGANARSNRKYQKANRETIRRRKQAANVVYRAIKSGKLVRPKKCQECKSVGYIEAHHKDYSKPLEIDWLCRKCHRRKR